MKFVFSILLALTAIQTNAAELPKAPSEVYLYSRYNVGDYGTATYSFRKMTQNIDIHRNNVDLLFEAREDFEDTFYVNMVVDDFSFIVDVGERSCKDIVSTLPDERQSRPLAWLAYTDASYFLRDSAKESARVKKNHCYLVYGNDQEGRVVALFHVRAHEKSKKVILDEIEVLDLLAKPE